MTVSFQYTQRKPNLACSICMEPMNDDAVIHENGAQHPLHGKCVSAWLKKKSSCPVCRAEVNPFTLFSNYDLAKHYAYKSASATNNYRKALLAGFALASLKYVSQPYEVAIVATHFIMNILWVAIEEQSLQRLYRDCTVAFLSAGVFLIIFSYMP